MQTATRVPAPRESATGESVPRELTPREDPGFPWPALRFPGDEEDEGEAHICRGID
jgi:hypothetical protein